MEVLVAVPRYDNKKTNPEEEVDVVEIIELELELQVGFILDLKKFAHEIRQDRKELEHNHDRGLACCEID